MSHATFMSQVWRTQLCKPIYRPSCNDRRQLLINYIKHICEIYSPSISRELSVLGSIIHFINRFTRITPLGCGIILPEHIRAICSWAYRGSLIHPFMNSSCSLGYRGSISSVIAYSFSRACPRVLNPILYLPSI